MTTETKRVQAHVHTRNLHEDLALCGKATPGSWESRKFEDGWCVVNDSGMIADMYSRKDVEDAIFIAEARDGWAYAIERALEAEEWAESLEIANGFLRHRAETSEVDIAQSCRVLYAAQERIDTLEQALYDVMKRLEKSSAYTDGAYAYQIAHRAVKGNGGIADG
jgi:hypothetical protein